MGDMDQRKARRSPDHNEIDDDLMEDEDLSQISGGLDIQVKACTRCGHRVAVFNMDICAECFRKEHPVE